jgi:hypothetical protein
MYWVLDPVFVCIACIYFFYTPTRREGAILQSPCPSGGDTVKVPMPKPYIKYKIISSSKSWDICYKNFHYGKHDRPLVRPSVCPSVHTFVKDVSAATGRNDFIFDTWLWHSDLYHVSPFQAYRTSTSCLAKVWTNGQMDGRTNGQTDKMIAI